MVNDVFSWVFSEKTPRESVMAQFFPCVTAAPGTGSPVCASLTVPEKTSWASAAAQKARRLKKIVKI